MNSTPVCVPQLGESIREARIVTILKKSGEHILRDEPLLEVETDKALYVMESPSEGFVGEWSCAEGAILPVGTLLVEIRAEGVSPERNSGIAPRVRERARRMGISPERLAQLVIDLGRSVTEADLDMLARGNHAPVKDQTGFAGRAPERDSPIAATIGMSFGRASLDSLRRNCRQNRGNTVPSSVEWIGWHTLTALEAHPRVRALIDENHTPRPQKRGRIGIAIELPDDELGIPVVEAREGMNITDFVHAFRDATEFVKAGRSSGSPAQVIISSLAHLGVESAIPIVTPPSVATIFVGSPYLQPGTSGMEKRSQLAITFDHRAFHGAEAARFLRDVVRGLESTSGITSSSE